MVIISHNVPSFYAYQQPIRKYFKRMFEMIWCAITGKEFSFFEVVIDTDKLAKFKKFVASL